jgi:AcrR family transcriptional regulator
VPIGNASVFYCQDATGFCRKGLTTMGAMRTELSAPLTAEFADRTVLRRRRGATLEDAIQVAVFAELAEVGYAAFTVESVAARAQTGKASIYRRWPTKQDLVLDAFFARFGAPDEMAELVADPTVSTRDVLLAFGRQICEVSRAAAEVVRAVACEVTRDAALADAVESRVYCPKREALVQVLLRGVARGDVRPAAACELFAELLPAVLMHRMVLLNRPVAEADVVEVVDRIVMPLVAAS